MPTLLVVQSEQCDHFLLPWCTRNAPRHNWKSASVWIDNMCAHSVHPSATCMFVLLLLPAPDTCMSRPWTWEDSKCFGYSGCSLAENLVCDPFALQRTEPTFSFEIPMHTTQGSTDWNPFKQWLVSVSFYANAETYLIQICRFPCLCVITPFLARQTRTSAWYTLMCLVPWFQCA